MKEGKKKYLLLSDIRDEEQNVSDILKLDMNKTNYEKLILAKEKKHDGYDEGKLANEWFSKRIGFEVILVRSPDRLKELNLNYM